MKFCRGGAIIGKVPNFMDRLSKHLTKYGNKVFSKTTAMWLTWLHDDMDTHMFTHITVIFAHIFTYMKARRDEPVLKC